METLLSGIGLTNVESIQRNLPTPVLVNEAIQRHEGLLAHLGPLVVKTGKYTGRSPKDKFMVKEGSSETHIWWGEVNRPISEDTFHHLWGRLQGYLQRRRLYVQDCRAGADPKYTVPLRIVSETAWHSLFARNLFIQLKARQELEEHVPEFTLVHAPKFKADPAVDGTESEAFIVVHFGKGLVLIGGTSYAGEIKKAVFTVMNYVLPKQSVLGMHCSANLGEDGDTALFFGLSGTGKTTLSTVEDRKLIGDDEHGWNERGIFNFEGGCYAKVINLSSEAEPEIYECTRKFGSILENVVIDPDTRRLDLNDASLTENTRAAYPVTHIPNAVREGLGPHPRNIFMLTADAFGVLPPISKLTPEQAMYYFLSGYTAKLAGTERGITVPKATFSTCFGAPFMALHPHVYAELLGKKIREHQVSCWLVNTGWTGGPFGVGSRMAIKHTRAMIRAALQGSLDSVAYEREPVFGLFLPSRCPGVPSEVLKPRQTWSDPAAYDAKGRELAALFVENFEQFRDQVDQATLEAGPQVAATVKTTS
jgi:phosphoenolpyruvate carboxykinase (ATP)